MSVLSRLTDSLLVRLLFRSILLLLHVDKMHYFFHTNFKLFALLSVQSLYSVQCVLPGNVHAYSCYTRSMEDLSDLSWKFQFSFGFPF